MLELLITYNNATARLDIEDTEITLTKLFSDLSDPAAISCGYSLGVKIPTTPHNNEILGRLFEIDCTQAQTFDQRKATPFILLNDGAIIYRGNFVLDAIHNSAGGAYYAVTLYDKRQDIFSRLDYTLGEPAESDNSAVGVRTNIDSLNVDLSPLFVKDDWQYMGTPADIIDANSDLLNLTGKEHGIVGTFPTARKWDNCDTSQFYFKAGNIEQFVGFANNVADGAPTAYEPHMFLSWKTYQLKPYVYIKALWQFLAAEIKRVSGYRVIFGGGFFALSNPYFSELVRTCHYIPQNERTKNKGTQKANAHIVTGTFEYTPASQIAPQRTSVLYSSLDVSGVDKTRECIIKIKYALCPLYHVGQTISGGGEYINLHKQITIGGRIVVRGSGVDLATKNVTLKSKYGTTGTSGYTITTEGLKTDANAGAWLSPFEPSKRFAYNSTTDAITPQPIYAQEGEIEMTIPANTMTTETSLLVYIELRADNIYPISTSSKIDKVILDWVNIDATIEEVCPFPQVNWCSLLGEDFNVLTEFTNLLKTFGLLAIPDYDAKTITLKTRGEYFAGWRLRVQDWSKKLHFEEGLESTEILAQMNALEYTYDTNESPLNVNAVQQTGRANNAVLLSLGYENETDTKPYLEGLQNSDIIKVTDYYFIDAIQNIIAQRTAAPWLYYDNDINGDALEERVGQLLFRGTPTVCADLEQYGVTPYFVICADTPFEIDNETYCGHVIRYPDNYAQYTQMIPTPEYNLNGGARGSEWGAGLYADWLARWDSIVYNSNNRQVKCRVWLTRNEFAQFDFNAPVIIDNNIYLCTAIDEYALNNETAAVTLLRLGNASLLDDLLPDFFEYDQQETLNVSGSPIVCTQGTNVKTIKVTASRPWTLTNVSTLPSWLTSLTFSPTSGGAGVTTVQVTAVSNTNALRVTSDVAVVDMPLPDNRGSLTANVRAGNLKTPTPFTDQLTITPNVFVTPNRNGDALSVTITVNSRSRWKWQRQGTDSVVTTGNASEPENTFTNSRSITINATSLAGNAGSTQTIIFTNKSGNTAVFTWRRSIVHNIWIAPSPQQFNYTTVSELEGHVDTIPFTIRANFDWRIINWERYMTDTTTQETPYKGVPELHCYNDGRDYQSVSGFNGEANKTYRMAWKVPRRLGLPDEKSAFCFIVNCAQHNDYSELVQIFCDTLKNTL